MAKGKEQRAKEAAGKDTMALDRERVEHVMGPLLAFGVYDHSGCPACAAAPEKLKKAWHPGIGKVAPDAACSLRGQHLHGSCTDCAHEWREQTKSAAAEMNLLIPAADIGSTAAKWTLEKFREETEGATPEPPVLSIVPPTEEPAPTT